MAHYGLVTPRTEPMPLSQSLSHHQGQARRLIMLRARVGARVEQGPDQDWPNCPGHPGFLVIDAPGALAPKTSQRRWQGHQGTAG